MLKSLTLVVASVSVLIVFVLVVCAYFLGKQSNSVFTEIQPSADSAQSTLPPARPPNTFNSGVPAGWKTYANRKYNYTIKYPVDLYLREDTKTPETVGFIVEPPGKDQGEISGVFISVRSNLSRLKIQDWWENDIKRNDNYKSLLTDTTRDLVTVDGHEALLVQIKKTWVGIPFSEMAVNREDRVYDFTTAFTQDERYKQYQTGKYEVFTQMLSTFKFLN